MLLSSSSVRCVKPCLLRQAADELLHGFCAAL